MYVIRRIRLGVVSLLLVATSQGAAQNAAQQAPPPGAPPLRPLTVTQLEDGQQGSDLDSTRSIAITVSEPIAITDLLVMLLRDTRLSVVADPDVTGSFRGDLKDVTLRQALDMILQPNGLDYSLRGNLVRVFKRRLETRRFDLNHVATRRTGSRTVAASSTIAPSAAGSPRGSSAHVTVSDDGDLFADVSAGVQMLISPDGRFNTDRKAALLQATDYPERLDQIQLYLDAVHTRASRQVQIQAKVIEVTLNDAFLSGINWKLVIERAGDAIALTQRDLPSATGGLVSGFRIKDFEGLLNALAVQGTVNVKASPTVNVLNNEPVIMRVGVQDVFFRTSTQTDTATGRTLQTTVEPQGIAEGIVLSVTPHIQANGMISMSITPTLTERTGHATSRLGDTVPVLSVRETDTLVRVRDNDTIVISGLMDEQVHHDERRVPVLGDLPGIGVLFRGQTTTRRKTDLVILLTPMVMTPERVATSIGEDLERVR